MSKQSDNSPMQSSQDLKLRPALAAVTQTVVQPAGVVRHGGEGRAEAGRQKVLENQAGPRTRP